MSSAYLLVSHGSRDPRPEIAMQQLAELVDQKLQNLILNNYDVVSVPKHKNIIGTACLEMSSQPLHEQIKQFAQSAFVSECIDSQQIISKHRLEIIPLFLLPGVHVMKDIPAEIALAQSALGEDPILELKPYLGNHPSLETLLARQMTTIQAEAWILLAHGSRRSGSQQPVETMATNLGAVAAYWATSPSLESQVKELIAAGNKEIAILPYFLFAGGITDAIAQAVAELRLQFPTVNFQLAQPLGTSAELADLIGDLVKP